LQIAEATRLLFNVIVVMDVLIIADMVGFHQNSVLSTHNYLSFVVKGIKLYLMDN
jgi:hypothetical protein